MDFAALPPEINSGRMYAGAGSGPMLVAAAAWDGLTAELSLVTAAYASVVSGLTSGPWLGPASVSMAAAAAPYVAWLSATAEQAAQAANQARLAVAAYEAAFAATVPPPVIAENRALLMSLVATNILGQNTPAIAATEMHYAEMWAQDATTMYSYAGASAAASTLMPFTPPPQTTNPAGVSAQAAAVGQAVGTSAAAHSPFVPPQLISTVPQVLQGLASGGLSGPTTGLMGLLNSTSGSSGLGSIMGEIGQILTFGSGGTFVASAVLLLLSPLLQGPIAGAKPASALADTYSPGPGPSGVGSSGLGSSAGIPARLGSPAVFAGQGRAASIGGLSVPQSWGWTGLPITRAATALPQPSLVDVAEAGPAGLGPGYAGMLPAGLMTAAAGGGGAAGGSWAAKREGAARTRYGVYPKVLPHEAGLHKGTHSQQELPDQHAQDGHGLSSDHLRDELKDLRRQIVELATERDLLMRSAALWAREALER